MLVNANKVTNTINLNYINSEIIKVPGADIHSYSTQLTPKSFRSSGGKRGISDIANVIGNILRKTDKDNASILISDCVFSPPKNQNAISYLKLQQVSIKDALISQLKKQKLSVAIYQMKARFDGHYYDHNSVDLSINTDRPYYVWFIGSPEQINDIVSKQIINQNDPHLVNQIVLSNTQKPLPAQFKVVNKGRVGSYDFKKFNEITNATSEQSSFGFGVAINFNGDSRNSSFFSDPSIYSLSNPTYSLTVRPLNNAERKSAALSGFTHLLTLKTSKLQTEELTVMTIARLPTWVDKYSSTDDSTIQSNMAEQSRTFGLSFLIRGVSDALSYYPNPEDNVINTIKIKISK
jgi:hypothetical protein